MAMAEILILGWPFRVQSPTNFLNASGRQMATQRRRPCQENLDGPPSRQPSFATELFLTPPFSADPASGQLGIVTRLTSEIVPQPVIKRTALTAAESAQRMKGLL